VHCLLAGEDAAPAGAGGGDELQELGGACAAAAAALDALGAAGGDVVAHLGGLGVGGLVCVCAWFWVRGEVGDRGVRRGRVDCKGRVKRDEDE